MVGDAVGHEGYTALPGRLLHDLSFSDARGAQKQDRALAHPGDQPVSIFIFG